MMGSYIPTEDFTDKVMAEVFRLHRRKQHQMQRLDQVLKSPPVRTVLAVAAIAGGAWNLLRICMLVAPALCR